MITYRVQNGQQVDIICCDERQEFLDSYEREPAGSEEWQPTEPDQDARYLYNDPNDKTCPRMIGNDEATKIIQGYEETAGDEVCGWMLAALREPGQYTNADEPWAAKARITRIA